VDLEKEQKLKVELHVKHEENNEVLEELKTTRQKINNIEKYNKDLEEIKVKRDSLQAR
jgi:transcriptional regulator